MKRIKVIGFDMDYTIVRYKSKHFEQATYDITIDKLVKSFGYPKALKNFKFDFNLAIRGLALDRELGNVIKVSKFGKVKQSFHGTVEQDYESLQNHYRGLSIDLASDRYVTIDTSFSIAHAALYSQMVDYMDANPNKILKSYREVEKEIKAAIDIAHRDNTLKSVVIDDIKKFIIPDPDTVKVLERFKKAGKKIWVITNSDYEYTKVMLDYTINPYLKDHENWMELFELVITSAQKPRFFTDSPELFKIHPETGFMKSFFGPIEPGCYHGGNATLLQEEFNYSGEDILYIGDHIYGDIVTL
ncbi:HAD-IG family 5'-nucleotidase, partial [Bacteriovoracaceae bacterium]|nr:HAD-IG family 5'-nucleotidase [Bacteriovoracaceae bacterium]